MSLESIPIPMVEYARRANLSDNEIIDAWGKYVKWHLEKLGKSDYRMKHWERQVAWAIRDRTENVPTTAESRALGLRQDALRRGLAEKAAYDREAMAFDVWVASLPQQHPMRRYRAEHPDASSFETLVGFGSEQARQQHAGRFSEPTSGPPVHTRPIRSEQDLEERRAIQLEELREFEDSDFAGPNEEKKPSCSPAEMGDWP